MDINPHDPQQLAARILALETRQQELENVVAVALSKPAATGRPTKRAVKRPAKRAR